MTRPVFLCKLLVSAVLCLQSLKFGISAQDTSSTPQTSLVDPSKNFCPTKYSAETKEIIEKFKEAVNTKRSYNYTQNRYVTSTTTLDQCDLVNLHNIVEKGFFQGLPNNYHIRYGKWDPRTRQRIRLPPIKPNKTMQYTYKVEYRLPFWKTVSETTANVVKILHDLSYKFHDLYDQSNILTGESETKYKNKKRRILNVTLYQFLSMLKETAVEELIIFCNQLIDATKELMELMDKESRNASAFHPPSDSSEEEKIEQESQNVFITSFFEGLESEFFKFFQIFAETLISLTPETDTTFRQMQEHYLKFVKEEEKLEDIQDSMFEDGHISENALQEEKLQELEKNLLHSESFVKLCDAYQLLHKNLNQRQIMFQKPLTTFSTALKKFINSKELKEFLTGLHDQLKKMPKNLLLKDHKTGGVKSNFYKWLFTIEWLDRRILLKSDIKEFDRYFEKYNKFLKADKLNQEPDEEEEPTKEEKRFKAAKKDHELTKILWTNAALSDSHLDFTKYDDGMAVRQEIEKMFKIEKIDPDVKLFSGDTYLMKTNNYNRIVTRKTFSQITSKYRGAEWHGLLCQEPIKIGLYNSEDIKNELSDEFVTNIPFIACVDITIDDLKTSMIKFFDYLTYENNNSSTSCYCYEHPETNELYNGDLSFYYSEIQMEWATHPVMFLSIASMVIAILVLVSIVVYKTWRSRKLRGYQNTLYGNNDTAVILEDMDDVEICQ